MGKIMTKQVLYDLFSNVMVKCWHSTKEFLSDHANCRCFWLSNIEFDLKSALNQEKLQFCLGVCFSHTPLFYKSRQKLLTTHRFVRLSKSAFLTWLFILWQKYFIQIFSRSEYLLLFMPPVFSVCHNCQSLSQNLELAILSHAAYLRHH